MVMFSDSPGSIYPALKRLETARLVRSTVDDSTPLRRRKLYRLSPSGKKALERWLAQPVQASDLLRGLPELYLRFSFLEDALGPRACETFLESMSAALDDHIEALREFIRATQAKMSRSGRLALQSGIAGYEGHRSWAKMALDEYRKERS
jgi:DNA-binding PadR family transcriptional regulator